MGRNQRMLPLFGYGYMDIRNTHKYYWHCDSGFNCNGIVLFRSLISSECWHLGKWQDSQCDDIHSKNGQHYNWLFVCRGQCMWRANKNKTDQRAVSKNWLLFIVQKNICSDAQKQTWWPGYATSYSTTFVYIPQQYFHSYSPQRLIWWQIQDWTRSNSDVLRAEIYFKLLTVFICCPF